MTPVIRISKGQPCPTSLAPYSGKFFNVHKFHRMPPETLEEIFMLLFSCNAHTTPLPVDVPAPHANLATRRNDEAKEQGRLFVSTYACHMTSSISTLVHFFVFITAKAGWPAKIKNSTTRHVWWKVLCVYAMCIDGHVQIHCWVRKPSFCTIHYKEYCEYFTLQDSMQTRQRREREPGGGVA